MPLAPHNFVALVDTRAVVLDVTADRYRLIVGRKAAALSALAAHQTVTDEAALDALAADGILVSPYGSPISLPCTVSPRRSAVEMPTRPGDTVSGAAAARLLVVAILRQKFGGFASVLRWAAGLTPVVAASVIADPVALAQSFDIVRRSIPVERICLRDSLALYALLLRQGLECSLVFGVRLDPFGAHCWVQYDDIILSDTLWSARPMQPILVL